jgi:nicotinate-nucleotide adenylyltransferase
MSKLVTRQRIGLFGGTFDPIHIGHLLIAETAREQLELEQVRFIPAAVAPHKVDRSASATPRQRQEMVQLAIWGNPYFVCDDRELRRGGVSYTVETLDELQRDFPDKDLVLIIGADSLHELHTWREPERICQLSFVAVVARGGEPPPDMDCLRRYLPPEEQLSVERHVIHMPQIEISSTDIRQRLRSGRSTRYLLPPAVEALVASQGLYAVDVNASK